VSKLSLELRMGGPSTTTRLERDRHCSICNGVLPHYHSRTCPVAEVKRLGAEMAATKKAGGDTNYVLTKLKDARVRLRNVRAIGLQDPPRETVTFPDDYAHNHTSTVLKP